MKTVRTSARTKSNECILMSSMLFLVIALYFIYVGFTRMTNKLLFSKTYPENLNENFFGLVASTELIGIFFFRSRLTLLLLPKCLFLISLTFFLYINLTPYGFYEDAFASMNMLFFGAISYCLAHFEIPAMMLPDGDFRKPTSGRPRGLYQPFFSLT